MILAKPFEGYLRCDMRLNSVLTSSIIVVDAMTSFQWHHACFVVDGYSASMYWNGVLAVSSTMPDGLTMVPSEGWGRSYIGRSNLSVDALWRGGIDDFRIYERGLTDVEVRTLYEYRGDGTAAILIAPCAAGSYSAAGSSACVACPEYSWSQPGASSCTPSLNCPAMQYAGLGSSKCAPCPKNSWSLSGATTCVANAGYYNVDDSLKAYHSFNPETYLEDISRKSPPLLASFVPPAPGVNGAWPSSNCAVFSQENSTGRSDDILHGQYFAFQNLSFATTSFSVCSWWQSMASAEAIKCQTGSVSYCGIGADQGPARPPGAQYYDPVSPI